MTGKKWGWQLIWMYDEHGRAVPLSQEWTDTDRFSASAEELIGSIERAGGLLGSRRVFVESAGEAWRVIERDYGINPSYQGKI